MTRGAATKGLLAIAIGSALPLAGCGYFPTPPDPIRITDAPADMFACRKLAVVADGIRTDGRIPYFYSQQTVAVPATRPSAFPPGGYGVPQTGGGDNFAIRLNEMRDRALAIGATDLLLSRRFGRDWAYVTGTAYLCPH